MVDLLAPSKKEVFTTTAAGAYPRLCFHEDLASLEAGGGVSGGFAAADGNGRRYSFRGELREDDGAEHHLVVTEPTTDDGLEDSVLGGAAQKVTRHDAAQRNKSNNLRRSNEVEARRVLIM